MGDIAIEQDVKGLSAMSCPLIDEKLEKREGREKPNPRQSHFITHVLPFICPSWKRRRSTYHSEVIRESLVMDIKRNG